MLYIFDFDGTLRSTKSGKPCPNTKDDQFILPNVSKKLHNLQQQGHILAVASNQGGVSWGYMTAMKAWEVALETNRLLGNCLQDIRLSFFHPAGLYHARHIANNKPKPDMLADLMEDFGKAPSQTCYVGNENTDGEAAKNAGCNFQWAHIFFEWEREAVAQMEKGFFRSEKSITLY